MPKSPLWTEPELDLLFSVVNSSPYIEIPKEYNRRAKTQGYPHRTAKAVWLKGFRSVGSMRATDGDFNAGTLAELLGLPIWTPENWVRSGKLKGRKAQGRWCFSDKNLADFARDYPELIGTGNLQALIYLFGEEKAIALKEKAKPPMVRPVKHLATGRIYPSMVAAGKALNYSAQHIKRKLIKGEFIYA